jgi:hypothetical protein
MPFQSNSLEFLNIENSHLSFDKINRIRNFPQTLANYSFKKIKYETISKKIFEEFYKLKAIDELFLKEYEINQKVSAKKIAEELKNKYSLEYVANRIKSNFEFITNYKSSLDNSLDRFLGVKFELNKLNEQREEDLIDIISEADDWLGDGEVEYSITASINDFRINMHQLDEEGNYNIYEDIHVKLDNENNEIIFPTQISFFHAFVFEEIINNYISAIENFAKKLNERVKNRANQKIKVDDILNQLNEFKTYF